MPEYTLRIRRYDPQSGEAAYWEDHTVEMEPKQSVLDAILKVKDDTDGSIGIRCSCQQAICGSCGVRMNGKPGLACNTHLDEAAERGACVSDGLSMEVDPGFIGPAALAKAYRFVGDPRDAEPYERLKDLSEDEHGIYDCTHCFNCIDACPKGVDPMSQIMRLRRRAGDDYHINDRNNGNRHERAFVTLIQDYGLLNEAELLPRSYGGNSWFGKFHPAAAMELVSSLSTVVG